MKLAMALAVLMAASGVALAGGTKVASLSARAGPVDPTRDVKAWHNAQNSKCRFKKVLEIASTTASEHGVESLWTIEGCGKSFQYRVTVIGGSTVMVANADGSSAAQRKP